MVDKKNRSQRNNMARWRDTKKGKVKQKKVTQNTTEVILNKSCSPLFRFKAFVTDMFMIMMPIMYITTYLILDGKNDFQTSEIARWVTMAIFGLIVILFWVKKGQTPGFKAYDLKIIDDNTKETLTYPIAIARYILFIISAVTVFGSFLCFFRKDKKTLPDILMQTSVIREDNI
jgi:uncharacterized RDD family membrane protein YckC